MTNNNPNPSQPWLKAILETPPATPKHDGRATLEAMFSEFSTQFTEQFGLSLDDGAIQFTDVPGISAERYQHILRGEDMEIASDDASDYEEETGTLMVAPYFIKHTLREWCNQQLPQLFKNEYAFDINHLLISELEKSIVMILSNYKAVGLIPKDVALPETVEKVHKLLEKAFSDTLSLYRTSGIQFPSDRTP